MTERTFFKQALQRRRKLSDKLWICIYDWLIKVNRRKQPFNFRRRKREGGAWFPLQGGRKCLLDYRSPRRLKYDLFRRLNTGGKPLNAQEIRNCLSKPIVQNALLEMSGSEEFKQATNGTVKDTWLQAQEIALRFLYFRRQYFKMMRKEHTWGSSVSQEWRIPKLRVRMICRH